MNKWIMMLLLVLFGGCLVAGHSSIEFRTIPLIDDDASANVIELTDLNFDAMVNGSSDWMINLHSEWYVFQTSVELESPLGGRCG